MLKSLSSSRSWFSLKTVLFTVLVFFGAQFVALMFIYGILSAFGRSEEEITSLFETNYTYTLAFSLAVAALVVAAVFWLLKLRLKKPLDYLLLKQKIAAREAGTVFLVYIGYFFVLLVVTALVGSATSVDINQQQELGFSSPSTPIGYAQVYLIIAVIPPILEEILFRGFLFGTLKRRLTVTWAAIMTSLLFGVAHLEYDNLNWIAAIDTLIFSGFLIYLVQRQKSLYGAMLLHCLKNSIAFYVLFVHK
jgi:membrane protease YdiL (CAAX protease family)